MKLPFETEYPEGMDMNNLKHISEVSAYNSNYFVGVRTCDILYGKSDDNDRTEWYLIYGSSCTYLGESYGWNQEKLCRYENPQT